MHLYSCIKYLTKTTAWIEDIYDRIRTKKVKLLRFIFRAIYLIIETIKTDVNFSNRYRIFKYFMARRHIKDTRATLERICIPLNSFCRFYTQVSGVSLHILRVCEIWHNCHHSLSFTLVKSPFSSICHLGMDFK